MSEKKPADEKSNPELDLPSQPKINVDDDWKSQVESEKQQLQGQQEQSQESEPELPPASFSMLVTSYATQAMFALGQIPDPMTGKSEINRPLAKHAIDLLGVIEEKTAGNLDQQESTFLSETLHHLRMAFVASSGPETGNQDKKSKIELP